MIRNRDRSRGGNGSAASAPVAADLPTPSSDNALFFGGAGGNTRYGGTDIGLPAGDWSVSFWLKVPATGSQTGFIFASNTGTLNSNSSFYIAYDKVTGYITASGRGSAGEMLGQQSSGQASVNARGLRSNVHIPPDMSVWCNVQKVGGVAQMWLCFPGNAPVKVDECITSYTAITTTANRIGSDTSSSNHFKGILRNFAKLSYSLTEAQMLDVANGTNPTTLGTPAANDFYFLLSADVTPIVSTIGSHSWSAGSRSSTVVTGVGYAPTTNTVFLAPMGWGRVFDQTSGSAAVSISGRYIGTDGGNIEAQFIDKNGVARSSWVTVATGISGKTWSGTIILPLTPEFGNLQLRKVGQTAAMTSTVYFGVGLTLVLSGQSSQDKLQSTTDPYGSSGLTLNGRVSTIQNIQSSVSHSGVYHMTITGITDNGSGFCRIRITTEHGLAVGRSGYVAGVLGTTEANGVLHTVTAIVDRQYFDTDVPFVNAYTSGGRFYDFNAMHKIYDESTGDVAPDGHIAIGNHISNTMGCVVQIYNGSVGGSSIEQHNQLTSANGINLYGLSTLLAGRAMGKVGCFLWRHGHANIGQTTYFSSGGSEGAWTGYGELGTLLDMYRNNIPNSTSLKFGLVPFPLVTGRAATDAANTHRFRWGMDDWVVRKNAAGDPNCFKAGFIHDYPAQWENGTPQNSHKQPPIYILEASRMAQCVTKAYGVSAYDGNGGIIGNGTRSGAVITLPIAHNGGSSFRVLTSGAKPSGFNCSTSSAFGSLLTITDTAISGNNVVITLSSDPGATVYVRYMWGQPGNFANNDYMTFRVTGATDNGAGLIRLKCEVSPTPALVPVSSQPAGGLTAYDGKWGKVQDIKGATQANGTWLMSVIDSETVDLVGSSSVGLGTFVAGENLYQTSATGIIAFDTAVPIYDDRTIGTYDPNGAPVRPLYTYVTAS